MPNRLTKGLALVGKLKTNAGITCTTLIEGFVVLPYASTISLDPTLGGVYETTTINATGNATINAASAGTAGASFVLVIANDPTSGKTITFGANFRPSATIVGTANKSAVITFVSDGVSFFEVSRQTGL